MHAIQPVIPSQPNAEEEDALINFDLTCLCDQLNDTTSLSNLPLSLLAEPPSAHNERHLGEAALAENFAVAEREEVEDGDGIAAL